MKMAKSIQSHLRNNLCVYSLAFNVVLSIISIITGSTAKKANLYNDPFLTVVPVSNMSWILFFKIFKNPRQKENSIEDKRTDKKSSNPQQIGLVTRFTARLLYMLWILFILVVMAVFWANLCTGVIILFESFKAHLAAIY